MPGILFNVWNPRVSTHRSWLKLYESDHRESMGALGCTHAPYNGVPPQTDGITQRFNRTIKTMPTEFVHEHKQNDWDTKLNKLSFAYNTAVHAVTIFSPFELMFGRIPKLPIDLVYDQTDSEELRAKIEVEWIASNFVEQQRKEMKAMFDFAAENRDAASLRASTLNDLTVRGAKFKVGDKVWVLDKGTKGGSNPKLRATQSLIPKLEGFVLSHRHVQRGERDSKSGWPLKKNKDCRSL